MVNMENIAIGTLLVAFLFIGICAGFIGGYLTSSAINTNWNPQHIPCGTATNIFGESFKLQFKITPVFNGPNALNQFLFTGQFPNGTYWIQLRC